MQHNPFGFAALPGFVERQFLEYRLDQRTIAIHLLDFDIAHFDVSAFSAAAIALPPAIAASVVKRQAEYFYGRLAARLALEHAGLPLRDIGTGAQREPLWPAGAVASITHNSRRAAAAALACGECRGIGIDVESVATPEQQESIACSALDGAELRLVAEYAGTLPRSILLTLVFSAKESFYKAVHADVGRFFGFDALRLAAVDCPGGRLVFTVAEQLSGQWQRGSVCAVHFRMLADGDCLTAFAW